MGISLWRRPCRLFCASLSITQLGLCVAAIRDTRDATASHLQAELSRAWPWNPGSNCDACGTASSRAGAHVASCFFFLRMCFPFHSDGKKHPKSSGAVNRHDATMTSDIKGCGALCTGSCPPAPPISMLPASLDDRFEQKRVFFSWRVNDPLGASIFPTLKLGERGAHALGHLIDSPSSWHRLRCIPTIIEGRAIFSVGVEWQSHSKEKKTARYVCACAARRSATRMPGCLPSLVWPPRRTTMALRGLA